MKAVSDGLITDNPSYFSFIASASNIFNKVPNRRDDDSFFMRKCREFPEESYVISSKNKCF